MATALILLPESHTTCDERVPVPHVPNMTDIYSRRILRSRAVGNRKAGGGLKKLWWDRQAGFRAKLRNCYHSGVEKTNHEFHTWTDVTNCPRYSLICVFVLRSYDFLGQE